ncbi:MAG: tRNA (adenosine(37)-N6)-threonylcarbamoyltransferase complex transferase subunit TsaD [bacterium]
MSLILGIETSCDETGAAVFDTKAKRILSHSVYSQIELHSKYGGVVPEIASRSQLEKIDTIVTCALEQAHITLDNLDVVAVTHTPGLAGALLIGTCFGKALAWSNQKKLIGVNHLEGHIFSPFLDHDGSVRQDVPFPHLNLLASGGHTALYLVEDFGKYTLLVQTLDDAAGEAFDKIAKIIGFDYPGGAKIEQCAAQVNFQDFFKYSRTKNKNQELMFSFSGIKTAALYSLVNAGVYDLHTGLVPGKLTSEIQQQVSSSLLVCVADVLEKNIALAFKKYPQVKAFTFGGGVACNKYLVNRFTQLAQKTDKKFFSPPAKFCGDNGAMIAFVGGYRAEFGQYSDFFLDVSC